ncbi:MAG: ATP-binding protein [Minwuiales bacterium]|nr:ATP-binding protein [Minwuiales bacterium]
MSLNRKPASIATEDMDERHVDAIATGIESVPIGLAVFDLDDRLAACNRLFLDCFPDLAGTIAQGASFDAVIGAIEQSAEAAGPTVPRDRDNGWAQQLGDGRWIQIRPSRPAQGCTTISAVDITAVKQSEIAARSELERGARAARIAVLEAENINRAKSTFLTNMSHELRTPLNAIIGFSDIIKGEVLGPVEIEKYREYAGDISDCGRHLLHLINDILDLSKVESGKLGIEESTADIAKLVDSCVAVIEQQAQSAGLAIHKTLPARLPALLVDERRFRQILLNLLSNAIKFTGSGGVVEVEARVAADRGLAVTVSDSGIGIAEDDIPMALAPFCQVENPMTRKHHGTGLGLPLTKALVEMHGGTLELASTVGAGTAVTAWFPEERIRERAA